jgi:GntR family transcriptional regulator, histidine utilization repressor
VDFSQTTPSRYLQEHYPLREVEHVVVAEAADQQTAEALAIEHGAPCLAILRRTWSSSRVATAARLAHPGDRFRLYNRFQPR